MPQRKSSSARKPAQQQQQQQQQHSPPRTPAGATGQDKEPVSTITTSPATRLQLATPATLRSEGQAVVAVSPSRALFKDQLATDNVDRRGVDHQHEQDESPFTAAVLTAGKSKKRSSSSDAGQASNTKRRPVSAPPSASDAASFAAQVADLLQPSHTADLVRILKQFDLAVRFGPCIGMSRLDRFRRAQKMSLHPPELVGALLDRIEEMKTAKGAKDKERYEQLAQPLFDEYKLLL
ncbi:hypothetical protein RI367_003798 [Sorochytrium milnesiophthora]